MPAGRRSLGERDGESWRPGSGDGPGRSPSTLNALVEGRSASWDVRTPLSGSSGRSPRSRARCRSSKNWVPRGSRRRWAPSRVASASRRAPCTASCGPWSTTAGVDTDDTGLRFRIGVGSMRMGGAYVDTDEVVHRLAPVLDRLAAATGETVQLARLTGSDVVYLAQRDSRHPIRLVSAVGGRLPAHATALGKAILAHYPAEEVDRRLPWRLENRYRLEDRHGEREGRGRLLGAAGPTWLGGMTVRLLRIGGPGSERPCVQGPDGVPLDASGVCEDYTPDFFASGGWGGWATRSIAASCRHEVVRRKNEERGHVPPFQVLQHRHGVGQVALRDRRHDVDRQVGMQERSQHLPLLAGGDGGDPRRSCRRDRQGSSRVPGGRGVPRSPRARGRRSPQVRSPCGAAARGPHRWPARYPAAKASPSAPMGVHLGDAEGRGLELLPLDPGGGPRAAALQHHLLVAVVGQPSGGA
jgi:hypothetical protein